MQMHEENALEIHFIYLGNKEIYCIFKICCITSVLFSTKYFIISSFSVQIILMFFIIMHKNLNTSPLV
jgi:hypothetical protein